MARMTLYLMRIIIRSLAVAETSISQYLIPAAVLDTCRPEPPAAPVAWLLLTACSGEESDLAGLTDAPGICM